MSMQRPVAAARRLETMLGAPYLPGGQAPRPAEEALAPFKAGLEGELEPGDLARCEAFGAARALFEGRYYWEAHDVFEAVWIRLPPASAERMLVAGLIQLANAGLKGRMGKPGAARRILALADRALGEAARRLPGGGHGLPAVEVAALRRQAAREEAQE